MALSFSATAAEEVTRLRLCTADVSIPPYFTTDGKGTLQLQLERVLQSLPLRVENVTAPRTRCLQDARVGSVDGMLIAYSRERSDFLVYPMDGGQPHAAAALATITAVVYRRKGDPTLWDGTRFSETRGRSIGTQRGYVYGPRLDAQQLPVDDGAQTTQQLLRKLALGRHAAAIVIDKDAQYWAEHAFQGQLEIVGPPFDAYTVYLAVTPAFMQTHGDLVQKLWAAIEADHKQQSLPAHPGAAPRSSARRR